MKPLKKLLPVALWLLRCSVLLFAYTVFFDEILSFSFKGIHYFVSVGFFLSTVLLFVGGFMKKPSMTVFSGLVLLILSGYKIFDLFDLQALVSLSPFVVVAAVGLLFAAVGNKS